MKTRVTAAAIAALAIGAFSAPAANAGTVCDTAGAQTSKVWQKYVSEHFEDVKVWVDPAVYDAIDAACDATP